MLAFHSVVWAVCCCASACCAGMLCAVLWARFSQVPHALLSLADAGGTEARGPLVAVCSSPARIAHLFEHALQLPAHDSIYLPNLFHQIIRHKPLAPDSLLFLEQVLNRYNLKLSEALMLVTPSCGELIKKCRWRDQQQECDRLFGKYVTDWGVCCIAWSRVLMAESTVTLNLNARLDLILNCSESKFWNGCEFYTKYSGEEFIFPTALSTGYYYKAQTTFIEVVDHEKEKLVESNCVSDPEYSRQQCFIRCKEFKCGCSDPLRYRSPNEQDVLPACSLRRLNCLRNFTLIEQICNCRQACQKLTADTILEGGYIDYVQNTYDPFFVGINQTSHTVLSIHISNSGTKVFNLMYNETWWSLLSSLGGVFNMFLGVGLFSALELIIFALHRLPLAIRHSAEVRPHNTNNAVAKNTNYYFGMMHQVR